MSFGSRELDRAYDNWKTQSPEDYYGVPDDFDDSVIKEEDSDDGFKCNRCDENKVAHHGNAWKCVGCGKYFTGKELFGEDDYDLDSFNIDVYRKLQFSGRGTEAYNLKKAYDDKKWSERKAERKEYYRGRTQDRKEELLSKGLCVSCGKNPIHTSRICVSCYEKKKESARRSNLRRRKKMEETKKNYKPEFVSFTKCSASDIPESSARKPSPFVAQAMTQMNVMAIGDVVRIPISEQPITDEQKQLTKKRYVYACRESAKKLDGNFVVFERGTDVYIERKL